MKTENLQREAAEMKPCPCCHGEGWYSDHNENSFNYETGEHECSGCPIQVECQNCEGTGRVENTFDPHHFNEIDADDTRHGDYDLQTEKTE